MAEPVLRATSDIRPWVSFCMTTYRRPAFLHEALNQMAAQTFGDFEVVISDNDPAGSAREVVAAFRDSRFKYFHNSENLGMVKSFNKSLERAHGEYVAMATDDDPVYPEMLQTLYDLHRQYPGYGLYIGGSNTYFRGLLQSRMAKARPGINSALLDMEIGAVKSYSSEEFPLAYLINDFHTGLLWSVAIVKREIALEIGGFPDFGSPHLADCGYTLLSGTRGGCVYINTALGHRTIHEDNYSHSEANYESIYKAPEGFYRWIIDRLPASMVNSQLKAALGTFIGRDMTFLVITIKRMLVYQRVRSSNFEAFRQRFFQLPWLKKWRLKYFVAIHCPNLFEFFLALRRFVFSMGKSTNP